MSASTGLVHDPAFTGDASVKQIPNEGTERGQWPDNLNLEYDDEMRLSAWLSGEIEDFFVERQATVENWSKWQRQFWAEPEQTKKDFPFENAANVVIPLTAIAVEAVVARIMNTLFASEPFFSIRKHQHSMQAEVRALEKFLQMETENRKSIDLFPVVHDMVLECVKLGTCVGKSGYKREFKKANDSEGRPRFYETYNSATLEYVPVNNFMMRMIDSDPQDAAWCGERHSFSWAQLKRMGQSGRMMADKVEEIKAWWINTNFDSEVGEGDAEETKREVADQEILWSATFDIDEIWCSFDVDQDGFDEEIVIDFHKDSGTILSIRYNWYRDYHRPYGIGQYQRVEGLWLGLGVAKQNEQFQEEVTTIHRQRLDNATLANTTQLVIKKGSGYGPDEPIFPGKIWFLNDPDRDLKNFKMAEVYASSYNNEDAIVRYSEKRTGVNEVLLGMPVDGTPGTATGDLQRVEEANKRFVLVLRNFRYFLGGLGLDLICNYAQFGARNRHFLMLPEKDAIEVEKIFRMDPALLRQGLVVDLDVTDSITNKQVEQQQWMGVMNIMQNYYNVMMQNLQLIAQVQGDPTVLLEKAQRMAISMDYIVSQLMQTMGVDETDVFELFPGEIDAIENGGGNGNGGGTQPGPADPTSALNGAGGGGRPAGNPAPDPQTAELLSSLLGGFR